MQTIPFDESLRIVQRCAQNLRRATESVPVRAALKRVLAQAVVAKLSSPAKPVAAMDGIAVDMLKLVGLPARLVPDDFVRVNTGDDIHPAFNAVVKIEDVGWDNDCAIVHKAVEFHQHIRNAGEDFSAGRLLLPVDQQLKPQDLSLLLASGCEEVDVYAKPVVAFIPTGSEFVAQGGSAVESNSAMIAGLVEQWGGSFYLGAPIPDDPEVLKQQILLMADTGDVVVVSAGTSMGTADYTENVLRSIGTVHFHGVAMSPAKPVLFAEVNGKPVLGLPGYPVSAYVAAHAYLRRILSTVSGIALPLQQSIHISAQEYPARDVDVFHRVQLFEVDGMGYAAKFEGGASSIYSLSHMDGLLHIPRNTPIKRRDAVRVDVIHDRSRNSVVVRGASDPLLFALFDLFREEMPGFRTLFWDAPDEDALQSIIERNAHMAVLATHPELPDLFPDFARQLRDVMLRYRMFGCTIGLVCNSGATLEREIRSGSRQIRVAVPKKREVLWRYLLQKNGWNQESHHLTLTSAPEETLAQAVEKHGWDATLIDIRFLREAQEVINAVPQYLDLVVSETYLNFPPIKKLIDLLLSDQFVKLVKARKGCEIHSRGLLQEA